MNEPTLEPGNYALVNSRCIQYVLDTKDGIGDQSFQRYSVAYPYIASQSQQWSLKTRNGVGWYLQNVASGLYLGLPADEHARNGLPVHEVEHEFEWYLKREGDSSNCFSLYVPYTRHVIDLNPGNPKPEMVLYIYEDGKGPHQVWHLCKDLHLETSKALVDGKIYRIVNGQSKTMMTLKEDYTVACFQSDLAEGQKFKAIKTLTGWAFRTVHTDRYLGIPLTIVAPDNGPRLSSVATEFTWMVFPHYDDRKRFRIWIPFTRKLMDLHRGLSEDDTPIHILEDRDVECNWWIFEEDVPPWSRAP
ncbi:hypothetical protein BKA70DRAFT_1406456 [Coprinopsis sp. MPI-PUGE-AT-0042]|nr:hypothetical protein BKA70DRAFT_1406456 [Coprinopsis sp. MPI-PUGE-AT-0042]